MSEALKAQGRKAAALRNASPIGRSQKVMNRRLFLSSWFFQQKPATVPVEVMEIFSASEGPSAFLIHHASEAGRNAFGEWLRANNGATVICQLRDGTTIDGRIFRVRMCFGRGLVLTRGPVLIRAKDVLTIK